MEKYRKTIPQEYVDFTKDALIKGNALRFETIGSLLGLLNTIATYGLPADYIKVCKQVHRSCKNVLCCCR